MRHLVEEPHDRDAAAHKRIVDMAVRSDCRITIDMLHK